MFGDGYAITSIDGALSSSPRVSLTESLGCTDTTVEAFRLSPGESRTLPTDRETVCVPLDAGGELLAGGTTAVPRHAVARVPPGVEARLRSDAGTDWLAVGAGMKANFRRLPPGRAVPYHTEGTQEELFVPLGGPGWLRAGGETHRMAAGSVARVAPATPRAAVNEGDADRVWFMIGTPPTGGPDEWDPGAEAVE
ncbi:hypothetical protein BRC83_04075 [Halobacteriales archaeon QS_1_68_17]|nr:MAG: hypothetical protein BRC83_04075 [Halobacteriales archaeon QS_1_68_17]